MSTLPTEAASSPESSPELIWQRMKNQIKEWYFKPDFQAVQIILASEASYQLSDSEQLWIHLVGPSSGGKTSLGIALVDGLYQDHYLLGEITQNTFLSGLSRGKQKGKLNSFLHQIGERGFIYAPDFTNFLASNSEIVAKVAGQLREIYDGQISRRVGSMETANNWKGTVAILTAFTPSKEHAWLMHNREGERFLTLRWPGTKPQGKEEEFEYGKILRATGDKQSRQEVLRSLVRELLETGKTEDQKTRLIFPITDNIEAQSYKLAELVGILRTLPIRPDGKTISHIAAFEGPGRVFKQLIKASAGWASLMGKISVDAEDWKLAERLAIDTIPEPRRWILESFPWEGGAIRVERILEMTPFENQSALEWHLNDLLALKVIGKNSIGEMWLKEKFVELAEVGCRSWVDKLRATWEERAEEADRLAEAREFSLIG